MSRGDYLTLFLIVVTLLCSFAGLILALADRSENKRQAQLRGEYRTVAQPRVVPVCNAHRPHFYRRNDAGEMQCARCGEKPGVRAA